MTFLSKKGSDNGLEDYFLDLLINKHAIDREIHDLLMIIDTSKIHPDYQLSLKRLLFGEKNLYLENWGTLGTSLKDIIESLDVRSNDVHEFGIILQMMIRVIEEVFNVDDEYLHEFIHSEEKEDIEHQLIILMKRMLDYVEIGIKELLEKTTELSEAPGEYTKDEFMVIKEVLSRYPTTVMDGQKEIIKKLKISVDTLTARIHSRKSTQRADRNLLPQ